MRMLSNGENIDLNVGGHTAGVSIPKPDYQNIQFYDHSHCLREQVEVLLA